MSAKCPLNCSAVELWYKMMLEIRNQSDLTENHIKRKAAGYQRLSSNWLWLFMAAYKPLFPDRTSVKTFNQYTNINPFFRSFGIRIPDFITVITPFLNKNRHFGIIFARFAPGG